MALYTYDEEAEALYVLVAAEADPVIGHTVEISDRLHVDVDPAGNVVGVEILYPRLRDVDLAPLKDRFGLDLRIPFSFAA